SKSPTEIGLGRSIKLCQGCTVCVTAMADSISEVITQKVPRPDYNVRESWIVVPKFSPSDHRHGKTSPEGGAGVYEVTFVLGIPRKNVFRDCVVIGQTRFEGDSSLLFPDNVETFEVRL